MALIKSRLWALGSGLWKKQKQRLFEPQIKADKSRKSKHKSEFTGMKGIKTRFWD